MLSLAHSAQNTQYFNIQRLLASPNLNLDRDKGMTAVWMQLMPKSCIFSSPESLLAGLVTTDTLSDVMPQDTKNFLGRSRLKGGGDMRPHAGFMLLLLRLH